MLECKYFQRFYFFFSSFFLKTDDHIYWYDIFVAGIFAFMTIVSCFVMCESGEQVTDKFEQFGEEFERCDWYKLPIEIQRMYLIFLSDTQQPKTIQSYGGVVCSRETCKRVRI